MNAKKNMIRTLIILAVVLVIYCVLAFVIPFKHTAVFWLSFVFTLIAILAQLWVLKTSFAHGDDARSKFYGFPIARVGLIYLVVQIIVGFICMALAGIMPVWVAVLIFVIVLGAAIIGLIAVDAVRDEIERQDVTLKTNVTAMRDLQSKTAAIASQCEDENTKKILISLAEKFRFSDPVSSDATAEAEAGLAALAEELQAAVLDGDIGAATSLAGKIEAALSERNRLCKLNK